MRDPQFSVGSKVTHRMTGRRCTVEKVYHNAHGLFSYLVRDGWLMPTGYWSRRWGPSPAIKHNEHVFYERDLIC